MEFQLEVKKYEERVAELESVVVKLQHELTLSREAQSDAAVTTPSVNDVATVTDQTSADSVEGTSIQPQEQVNTSHTEQVNHRYQTLPRCHILMILTKHCSCLISSCYCHLVNSC